MKFIVKLFPEITIKSRSVRMRFCKRLAANVRAELKLLTEAQQLHACEVTAHWDFIDITGPENGLKAEQVADVLSRTPGIAHYQQVLEFPLTTIDDMLEPLLAVNRERLKGKTFAMRVKRVGTHDFTSLDLERHFGGALKQLTEATGVSLKNPDVQVRLEVRHQKFMVETERKEGLGGFPIGSQEDVLSLMSGGFDSAVATYLTMKRGCKTHFCFFNLGGSAHEIGVRQIANYIWKQYGSVAKVYFVSVPFDEVVGEILEKVDNSHMGVILKRMMMRAANRVASRLHVGSLVTGESVAQVSSQTLTNLNVIDNASDRLVVRPLIVSDKQDIINQARKIGTYEMSSSMPEYCGVISVSPTVKARPDKVLAEEAKLDMEMIQRAIERSEVMKIDQVLKDLKPQAELDELEVREDAVVIDIRHPTEEEKKPLDLPGKEVVHIPFYKLATSFSELDSDKQYLLYCDRGVMSKLHALYLHDAGHENVGVYSA
ncbi:tRNA uracil 4-sulfurtransferase ThiI [Pokkaliibacter sp. CJK22405]|uniref:tRNA uracil 4-sulfurtransferase ThiI n=1 Tax=Pokkaliibacter sp. CJK22405 TaxID=3384615 RepID=UPI00398536D4